MITYSTSQETYLKSNLDTRKGTFPFYLVLLYLLMEFGRPQDSVPGFASLRLPMLVSICLIVSILLNSKTMKFADRSTKLFVAFLILMLVHIPFAVNNYYAFFTTYGMVLTFIVYLGILMFVDSRRKFKTLIAMWVGIHVCLAILGLRKSGVGIGGFLGDENDFCLTLVMILPYAYFLTFSDTNFKEKMLHLALAMVFLATIMATFSRGGFLGLLSVGAYLWLRSPRKGASACVILLFAFFAISFAPNGYWEEMSTIQKEYSGELIGTGEQREYEWSVGWKMFRENPIFGVGQGNFPWEFNNYEENGGWEGRSLSGRAAHSLYYTLMPELGLVGLVLFIAMNYCVVKNLSFVRRVYGDRQKSIADTEARFFFYSGCAIEASLIGYLVSGYFISVLYYPNFWVLMAFAATIRNIAAADDDVKARGQAELLQ